MQTVNQSQVGYSDSEEQWNVISHAIGLSLAIIGLLYLITRAQGVSEITAVSIYGGTLIFMFLTSTIYHATTHEVSKGRLKIIDHSAIYLLIAGSYTPYLALSLDGLLSTVSVILIWSMALLGIFFKLFTGTRFPKVSLITYLAMGWFVIAIIYPLCLAVSNGGLWLLFSGGMFFSVGVFFYRAKSIKYTHAIWHLFVVGGCLCHYYSIYYFVI